MTASFSLKKLNLSLAREAPNAPLPKHRRRYGLALSPRCIPPPKWLNAEQMDQLNKFVVFDFLNQPLQHQSFQHHTFLYHGMLAFIDRSIVRCKRKPATSLRGPGASIGGLDCTPIGSSAHLGPGPNEGNDCLGGSLALLGIASHRIAVVVYCASY